MKRSVDRFGVQGQGKLPVSGLVCIRVAAEEPGPTVVIVSGVHGDELTGMAAIHALDPWLSAHLVRGTVVLVPCANPDGTVQQVRHVPGDHRDLNRCFPGDPRGTASQQLADAIFQLVESVEPSLLVDLHSDSGYAIPYAILDRPVALRGRKRTETEDALRSLADSSGLIWFWEYPDLVYRKSGLERSLSGAVVNRMGVPALTLEIGPKGRIDSKAVDMTVDAVKRILNKMEMTSAEEYTQSSRDEAWCRASAPRNAIGGRFEAAIRPGERFTAGVVLGQIRSVAGDVKEEIKAEEAGMVLSWNDSGWLSPGSFIGTLAVPEVKAR